MEQLPNKIEMTGVPPYVEIWSVARIANFIPAVLGRWQRERGPLPPRFHVLMCPQVEVNAVGGLPARVVELTDPRLRCHHFTGCHKPYFVVFFVGEDAERRLAQVQEMLSWSESYRVDIGEDAIRLAFVDAVEDTGEGVNEEGVGVGQGRERSQRTLRDLLATGEIVSILE